MTYTTEQLADQLHLKPQSLRAALCRDGHYFGIRPVKMPNGRLLWPADTVEHLAEPITRQGAFPQRRRGANAMGAAHA